MQDLIIETTALTKSFGPRKAIQGLSFSVQRGETVALLGTNGSGKTTTMRILCGYLPPTGGVASVAGFDVVSHSLDVRKAVGYLPEDVPLYADLTIRDSLRFFGALRKMRGRDMERRIDDVIEQVGLTEYRDVLILKLSKGYRQRAGLAIAILHEPDLLILDEPTVSIDPVQVAEVKELIRSLGTQHTVLLSTHQLSEAADLCSRAVVLSDGQVVADGLISEITKSNSAERRIRVEAKEGSTIVMGQLVGLASVTSTQECAPSLQGINAFTVTGSGPDLLNDIVVALVHAGVVVVSVEEEHPSLESAFLDLARTPKANTVA